MERIRTRAEFQAVLAHPPVATSAHFALHAAPPDPVADQPRVGVVLPKRWARRAVTRNTLRRQIYVAALSFAQTLPHQALVVRLRRGFDTREFPSATSDALKRAARAELNTLLGRICTPAPAPSTPGSHG